jgi:hypothetical protein
VPNAVRDSKAAPSSFFSQHPSYGPVHVDMEYLEDSPSTLAARAWLRGMIEKSKQ